MKSGDKCMSHHHRDHCRREDEFRRNRCGMEEHFRRERCGREAEPHREHCGMYIAYPITPSCGAPMPMPMPPRCPME
jgi:hypothetical protein